MVAKGFLPEELMSATTGLSPSHVHPNTMQWCTLQCQACFQTLHKYRQIGKHSVLGDPKSQDKHHCLMLLLIP